MSGLISNIVTVQGVLEKCHVGMLYQILMEEEWLSKDYTVMDLINQIKKLKKVTFYTESLAIYATLSGFQ